jgi:CDP-glucose 4,6-dehydratase
MSFSNFYRGKTVLVTGHTGFKGSWLALWLHHLGANVIGYSLPPQTTPSLYQSLNLEAYCTSVFGDVRDAEALTQVFNTHQPEIVLHLAAQPLVRYSYAKPVETYATNVMGSLNVLEAARHCPSVKAVVNVTTDKCYENKEVLEGYREDDAMGGYDMYSSSKGCVELLSASFRRSFLTDAQPYALATARAGNVIGGGDWSADRLIPDCVLAIEADRRIEIRHPEAVRPWQHVLEPLSGYLLLGQRLYESGAVYAEGFNFGPNEESVLTVGNVVEQVIACYGRGEVVLHKTDALHEATLLTLNIEKAADRLQWTPKYTAAQAIGKTIEWYQSFYADAHTSESLVQLTLQHIKDYENVLWNNNYATLSN